MYKPDARVEITPVAAAVRLARLKGDPLSRPTLKRYVDQGFLRGWTMRHGSRDWLWLAVEDVTKLLDERKPRQTGPTIGTPIVPLAAASQEDSG